MKALPKWLLSAAAVAALVQAIGGCGIDPPKHARLPEVPDPELRAQSKKGDKVGAKCPDFSYSLIDGGKAQLASYAGKHLLIYVTSYT